MKSIAAAARSVAAFLLVLSLANAASAQEAQPDVVPTVTVKGPPPASGLPLPALPSPLPEAAPASPSTASPSTRDATREREAIQEAIREAVHGAPVPVVVRTVPVQPGAGLLPASPPNTPRTWRDSTGHSRSVAASDMDVAAVAVAIPGVGDGARVAEGAMDVAGLVANRATSDCQDRIGSAAAGVSRKTSTMGAGHVLGDSRGDVDAVMAARTGT